jgi:hypothetical protein
MSDEITDFSPEDNSHKRTILSNAIRQARERWYVLDLERISRELTAAAIKAGKFRANDKMASAGEQIKPRIDDRLAQIIGDQEQVENEIRVYTGELKALPEPE